MCVNAQANRTHGEEREEGVGRHIRHRSIDADFMHRGEAQKVLELFLYI